MKLSTFSGVRQLRRGQSQFIEIDPDELQGNRKLAFDHFLKEIRKCTQRITKGFK